MVGKRSQPDRERDPIAELARLIAQSDPHEESAPADNRFRKATVSDGYDERPELPPAPQLPDLSEHETACTRDEHCSSSQAHDIDDQPYAAEEEYQDSEVLPYAAEKHYQDSEVPHVRRRSLTFAMAMFGLALVGTAGAFGYRQIFGSSPPPMPPISLTNAVNEPNKSAPPSREPQSKESRSENQVLITGSIEHLVSRNEKSATVEAPKSAARVMPAPLQTRRGSPPVGAPTAADQVEPKQTTRLAAAAGPDEPANANSSSEVTPPALGGYAVQVTSERSESAAQAAFRRLQVKYPSQLSGRQPVIRRADLGATGIYYRALVGHFASVEKAAKWCNELKAAGGDCIVQKN